MTDRLIRQVLAIVLARVEEGAAIEIPAPHREALREILDNEYARPVRLLDKRDGTFAIRRTTLALRAKQ
jgi:hypothetical protein